MSVLDQLPDGEPLRLLREQQEIDREIKSQQRIGQDSIITSRVFSADAFDIQTPGSGSPVIEVEFIPDDLIFGGALCYQFYAVDVTNPASPSVVSSDIRRLRVKADNRQRWLINASLNQKLKFYFFTAGSGTFKANLV